MWVCTLCGITNIWESRILSFKFLPLPFIVGCLDSDVGGTFTPCNAFRPAGDKAIFVPAAIGDNNY